MEQSFVNTDADDDSPMLKRDTRRAHTPLKSAPEKRKLKPGLY